VRTIAPRTGGREHMSGEDVLDASPVCFTLAKDAAGRPCVVTRWTFTAEERAAIVAGADLLLLTYLDDRPLPDVGMIVTDAP
jgi:hypothetical protein